MTYTVSSGTLNSTVPYHTIPENTDMNMVKEFRHYNGHGTNGTWLQKLLLVG